MLDIAKDLDDMTEAQPPPTAKLQPDSMAWHLATIANHQPKAFSLKLAACMARKKISRVDMGIELRDQNSILTCHYVCMLLDGDMAWNGLHMTGVAGILKWSTATLMKAMMDTTVEPVLDYVDAGPVPKDLRTFLIVRPTKRMAPAILQGLTGAARQPSPAIHRAPLPALTHKASTMDKHDQTEQFAGTVEATLADTTPEAVTEAVAEIMADATAAAKAASPVPADDVIPTQDLTDLLAFANGKRTGMTFKTRAPLLIAGGGLKKKDFLNWMVALGEFKLSNSANNLFGNLNWSPKRMRLLLLFTQRTAAQLLKHVQTVDTLEKAKALGLTLVVPPLTNISGTPAEVLAPIPTVDALTAETETVVSEPEVTDDTVAVEEEIPAAETAPTAEVDAPDADANEAVVETPEPDVEAEPEAEPEAKAETVLDDVVETPEAPATVTRQPKPTTDQLLHTTVLQQLQELAEDTATTDAEKRRTYARLLGVLNGV